MHPKKMRRLVKKGSEGDRVSMGRQGNVGKMGARRESFREERVRGTGLQRLRGAGSLVCGCSPPQVVRVHAPPPQRGCSRIAL